MERYLIQNRVVLVVIAAVLLLSVFRLSKEKKIYPAGDAVEYTIMTEALFNHLSPDVRPSDFDSFKAVYSKKNKWQDNPKYDYYDTVRAFIAEPDHKNLVYNHAFFVDKSGNKYSQHFFFYSVLNLPVRAINSFVKFNPLLVGPITNILLIVITIFFIFKYSSFGKNETAIFSFLFFYSANYWYISWQHPEVLTSCLVALGTWLFFHRKFNIGILLVALASLQNQPLAILVLFLTLTTFLLTEKTVKNILLIGICSIPVLFPSIFYYLHYGVTNLVQYQGATSFSFISFSRVFGFFFDINQGLILAFPLILFIYIFLIGKKIVKIKRGQTTWDVFMPLALVGCVCFAATINNWNHGQAVVNRYVTYIGSAVLVHSFILIQQIRSGKIRSMVLMSAVITQILTVYYFQNRTKFDWSTNEPKPISNWFLERYPSLYNPDPTIFLNRYGGLDVVNDPNLSPVYYLSKQGRINKLLVHDQHLYNLEKIGMSRSAIDSIAPTLNFVSHWAYVPATAQLQRIIFSPEKLKKIDIKKRVEQQIQKIKISPDWYRLIQEKVKSQNIPEEEILLKDACFVLNIDPNSLKE